MTNSAHHLTLHKLLTSRKSKRQVNLLVYVVGIGGNLAALPQIIRAWQSSAPGLAILTWVLYAGIGLIWLVYALQQKQKPLIAAQLVGITCNVAVVLGWLFNNAHR